MKSKRKGNWKPTKLDWQKWYAHKSNKELAIEEEERKKYEN